MAKDPKSTEEDFEWSRRGTCIFTGTIFLGYSLIMAGIVIFNLLWTEDRYGVYQSFRPFFNIENSTLLFVDKYFEVDRIQIKVHLFVGMVSVCFNIFYIIGCLKRDTCLIQTWVVYQIVTGVLSLFSTLGCTVRLGKGIGMIALYLSLTVFNTACYLFCTYQALAFRREILADNANEPKNLASKVTKKTAKKPIINPV